VAPVSRLPQRQHRPHHARVGGGSSAGWGARACGRATGRTALPDGPSRGWEPWCRRRGAARRPEHGARSTLAANAAPRRRRPPRRRASTGLAAKYGRRISASPARRVRTMTWSLCEARPSAPGLTRKSVRRAVVRPLETLLDPLALVADGLDDDRHFWIHLGSSFLGGER
jgi:hypothetical protein